MVTAMRAHEVLDLVSDEEDDDGRQQQDENRAPSEAEMESKYDSPPPSSSHRKRRHLALVAPDASAIDDALSVVSISDAEQGSTPAHRRPHFAPASSSDDDESGDLSNADVHADFTTSTTPALSLALTPSTLSSDVDTPATSAALRPKKRPKRSVARYFGGGEDLSLKCWNCSSGGHTAADCPQERLFPPCYVCGQSTETHEKGRGCPNELCWRCGGAGHTKIDCKAVRFVPRLCYRCGSTSHEHPQCNTPPSSGHWDLSSIHCLVCGGLGHINCAPPSLSSTPLHCSNCASSYHSHHACRLERMPKVTPIEDYSGQPGGASAHRRTMECFRCGAVGHGKRDCPELRGGWNRGAGGMRIVGASGGAGGIRLSLTKIRETYSDKRGSGGGERFSRSSPQDRGKSSKRSASVDRRSDSNKRRRTR